MPQPHQPFTYIPLTNIAPIACPHCGVIANLMTCLPHPEQPKAEIRTFTCKHCGKQTEMTVRQLSHRQNLEIGSDANPVGPAYKKGDSADIFLSAPTPLTQKIHKIKNPDGGISSLSPRTQRIVDTGKCPLNVASTIKPSALPGGSTAPRHNPLP